MLKYNWLNIVFMFSVLSGAQQNLADSLFVDANRYMNQEKFEKAGKLYERILQHGNEHPSLYYNLGNAYYRLGIYGQAVWAYEKALQFTPRDPDVKFNLDMTNARIRDRIEIPDIFFLLDLYRSLKKSVTIAGLISVGSILLLLASFVYFMGRFFQLRIPGISQLIIILIVLSVIVHGVALDKYWELSDQSMGVVIAREVEAYSVPFSRKDAVQFKIHEGIKVEINQLQPNWFEIILIDGKKGWVRTSTIREL